MAAAGIVALAFGVRLAWVLLVPSKPVGDFAMYLESADHLVAHGAFDGEFVYMPGYVLLLAAMRALGGGLLACKMIGVVSGGVAAGAVYGIARELGDRRSALVAGLAAALWPAGVAMSSVTGTDMPAAALIALAAWALVRWGRDRPGLGVVLFGVVMGLAATVRAVSLPLAALGAIALFLIGVPWRAALRRGVLACVAAALVLLPWGLRNHARYGEFFLTDSHGGLTALVGADPNTEGAYSRSLNRMFLGATGYTWLAEPHRAADRAAYAAARDWASFAPAHALGLVARKAERLLGDERPLLYWPLFRAGVLAEPQRSWFAARRPALEAFADAFWRVLVATAVVGFFLAFRRRQWRVFAFVPFQVALIALYSVYFAETRYRLPIALFLFPPAGAGLVWLAGVAGDAWRARRFGGAMARDLAAAAAAVAVLFLAWAGFATAGRRLRAVDAWAVHACRVGSGTQLCKWRHTDATQSSPVPDGGTALAGVWNGVGLAVPPSGTASSATEVDLPAGSFRVSAALDLAPDDAAPAAATAPGGVARVQVNGTDFEVATIEALSRASRAGLAMKIDRTLEHRGGRLSIRILAEVTGTGAGATWKVWLSDLAIEPR